MTELRTFYFDELEPGMAAELQKTVSAEDVIAFAGLTGDCNPIHLDADYAAASSFKKRVAHGMLTGSLLSAVFGTRLPGPGAIYVSQTLNFRAPVFLGDTVTARVRVHELYPVKSRVRFDCECLVADRPVLMGEAMLIVPSRPG